MSKEGSKDTTHQEQATRFPDLLNIKYLLELLSRRRRRRNLKKRRTVNKDAQFGQLSSINGSAVNQELISNSDQRKPTTSEAALDRWLQVPVPEN